MSVRKRPKGSYRYSIVPAGAITDPDITPRDLQVLCLLGRHTDDNGWCRRSQVKMGDELNCDRRTVQRALDRLAESGYVQQRAEGRGDIAPPTENEHPFAAYSYRVLLDLDADEEISTGAQKCAGDGSDTVRKTAQGVRTHDAQGVRTSCAPLTEPSPCEPSPCEQTQGARATAAPAEEKTKPAKSAFDERIWPEFRKCPGFSDNMAKASARKAFENIAAPRPETGQLVDAIRAWARFLANENAKPSRRNNPHPMAHPATWLHQRRWEGFLDRAPSPEIDVGALAHIERELQEFYKPALEALGAACMARWLEGCTLTRGPPHRIAVAREHERNWLATQLIFKLRRIFGEDLQIERKQEAKAA